MSDVERALAEIDRWQKADDARRVRLEEVERRLGEVEARQQEQLRGAEKALREIVEASEHPSLTVRSTSYMGKVARDALHALRGAA